MRSVRARIEALEQQAPSCDEKIDTILVTFIRPTEHPGDQRCEVIGMRDSRTDWRLDREPNEDVGAFHERAKKVCPRPEKGVAMLFEVLKGTE
jgi:hypothetical protein